MLFPFHSESERDWFAWLGLYVSAWAGAEHALDLLVRLIYNDLSGARIEKEMPLNLDRRIKFIKRAASRISELSEEKDSLLKMMDALKISSDFRHLLVHGTDINFYKRDPFTADKSIARDRKSNTDFRVQMNVKQSEIEDEYEKVGYIGLCLIGVSYRVKSSVETEMNNLQMRIDDIEKGSG